jgi:hypothetical protein
VYQQLEGGLGRAVYFRAPRIKADVLVRGETPIARLGSAAGRVRDLSTDGMLLDLSGDAGTPQLGSVMSLELHVRNEELFTSAVEVVRAESIRGAARVAVRFINSVLDPDVVRARVRDAVFRDEFRAGLAVYDAVPNEYRLALNEAVLVLSHWRDLLEEREREILDRLPDTPTHELADLQEGAAERVAIDWLRVHARASHASKEAGISPQAMGAAKRLTETLLTPILVHGPIWRHAYAKPRGYPGDFELMNMMYEDATRGHSVFARVMHQLGKEERLAATVRDRKDFLLKQLLAAVERKKSSRSDIRITNIGSGPARELEEFLLAVNLDRRLHITLVDQDQDALQFAHDRLRRAALRHGDKVVLRCLFVSFKRLLANSELVNEVREQDLIYTAGFFDYLPGAVASALLTRLVGLLRGQGRLLIGNAVDANHVKWVPTFVLDWDMIYRTPDDMRALASHVAGQCRLDVDFDESAAWQFLSVQRIGP